MSRGGVGPTDPILRSRAEILDACDLVYRYNWTCVEGRVNDGPIGDLNPSVAFERHWALNWLIGYQDQDWADISTDT